MMARGDLAEGWHERGDLAEGPILPERFLAELTVLFGSLLRDNKQIQDGQPWVGGWLLHSTRTVGRI